MERPSLPTEVCEQTIDWLVIGYTPQFGRTYYGNVSLRRDLSNCALVCHAWRPRAQMYLFAFLRISGKGLSQYEAILLKSPILCGFAKELYFYNEYVGQSQGKTTDKTVETASHALRIAHKLPHVYYFVMNRVNMASEHTHLPKYMTALRNINQLYFFSPTPAKLSQIARMIVGLKGLSTLYLRVPIIVDSNPLPLPVPCYATKSSLARLELVIGPGGHSLLDWLVHANSFTTSLQVLQVGMEDPIPQSEVTLAVQGIQSLLDRCREHLKEWYFGAKIGGVNDTFPKITLESHTALTKLDFRVSKAWFGSILEQVKSITSKHITEVFFYYWLDVGESPSDGFWQELDTALSVDRFKSLLRVEVGYVHKDEDSQWHWADYSDCSKCLPNLYNRGLLS